MHAGLDAVGFGSRTMVRRASSKKGDQLEERRVVADTWVIDMRHYLDEGGDLPDLPNRVLILALYFGSIVAWMTSHAGATMHPTNVICRRRPGRRQCIGEIFASYEGDPPRIAWSCPLCGDNGFIHGWEDTIWDRGAWRRPQPRPSRPSPN